MDRPRGDRPPHRLFAGNVERHEALRIHPKTHSNRLNSILLPGIDMRTEVDLINFGHGERVGTNRYRINNRTYVDKGTGETFPEHGEDIVVFSRRQYRYFLTLLRENGLSVATARMVAMDPNLDEALAVEVERLFSLIMDHKGQG